MSFPKPFPGPAVLASALSLLVAACGGPEQTADAPKAAAHGVAELALPWSPAAAPRAWTGQDFPAEGGNAQVADYYQKIEEAIASDSVVMLPTVQIDTFLGLDEFGAGEELQLRLQPSRMLQPDAFFEINGLPYEGPFMRAYEGHVDGAPDNYAHVLVAADFIRGAVRIGDRVNVIRVAMQGNLPLAAAPGDLEKRPFRYPRGGTPSRCPDDGIPANSSVRAVPPYLSPANGLGLVDAPELHGRVIVDGDRAAYERWGEHLPAMMVGMVLEADLAYRYEVGIRHSIVGIHLNLLPDYYPDPEVRDPFNEVGAWWDSHHLGERDIVHLFTGYDSSYAQANCIGSTGTTAGYSFSSIFWEEEYARFHENALAHEFGHLYAAHHHYGNHVESELATIMIMGYTPGAQPQFSSLSRTVIRGWAEEYLQPWE